MLENFSDFYVPLLKVLDGLPDQTGQSSIVLKIIENRYRDQIAPNQLDKNQSGRVNWIYNVRMCFQYLKRRGFIDNPNTGIWRLTAIGQKWLQENPDATHLSVMKNVLKYNELGNSLSKKKIQQHSEYITDHHSMILSREIAYIRSYLSGQGSLQPSDEKLCDWVNFCYTFELYVEGVGIFSLVNPDAVHPWYYERTKKIARSCALRMKYQEL